MGDSRSGDRLASPDLVEALEAFRSTALALDSLIDSEAHELERRIGGKPIPRCGGADGRA